MNSWQTLSTEELFEKFETSSLGISEIEVEKRHRKYGFNELPQKKVVTWVSQFLSQLKSPLIYILSVAALLKLFLREVHDFAAILFVIIFNAFLGFFQERKADESLKALKNLSAQKISVVRGSPKEIEASKLVPGDVIFLESGTKIPADARLFETHNLSLDESTLTGESVPVIKSHAVHLSKETPLIGQTNMVFSGTVVTSGRGKAVVVATGSATHLARIANLVEKAEPPTSPLKEKLEIFGKRISINTLFLMMFIVFIGYLKGFSIQELIMTCVSLSVSAIPEGLPIAVTVALSYGLLEMARKNAIVRKLPTIETLGCTTVICTDKTGTITKNEMVVDRVFVGYERTSLDKPTVNSPSFLLAAKAAFYCSEVREQKDGSYIGDPVDIAIKNFGSPFLENNDSLNSELILPFESEIRMMACTLYENKDPITFWKGSFETIATKCSTMWENEKIVPFSFEKLQNIASKMANEGYKIIALASKAGIPETPLTENALTFIGILGLYDPPRKEAKESIEACQRAGIKVLMVTGDHPLTALEIARQVGLTGSQAISGDEIDNMSDEKLLHLLKEVSVCARVSPHQKWRIVKLLQSRHEVVAMTGDGVNDAPALQQADIGIALGSGTDVAKEASSMVILDNNFATIVTAIKQGRSIFKNLQQMAMYLLTTCLGGVLTIAGSVSLGLPLPLLPLQLLWINLVTDGTTTVPLALEGGHGDILAQPPRARSTPFISTLMLTRAISTSLIMMAGTISVFAVNLYMKGCSLSHAQTMAFTTLAFFQIFNALNSRSVHRSLFFSYKQKGKILHKIPFFQNKWLLLTLLGCVGLQVLAVEWNPLHSILGTTDLTFRDWISIVAVTSCVILAAELQKAAMFFIKRDD